jgi:hypothetical protein
LSSPAAPLSPVDTTMVTPMAASFMASLLNAFMDASLLN